MGLPSRFFEKKFVKDEKGDDITPFDGSRETEHNRLIDGWAAPIGGNRYGTLVNR